MLQRIYTYHTRNSRKIWYLRLSRLHRLTFVGTHRFISLSFAAPTTTSVRAKPIGNAVTGVCVCMCEGRRDEWIFWFMIICFEETISNFVFTNRDYRCVLLSFRVAAVNNDTCRRYYYLILSTRNKHNYKLIYKMQNLHFRRSKQRKIFNNITIWRVFGPGILSTNVFTIKSNIREFAWNIMPRLTRDNQQRMPGTS